MDNVYEWCVIFSCIRLSRYLYWTEGDSSRIFTRFMDEYSTKVVYYDLRSVDYVKLVES